jgi:hypothetical protein
MRPSLVVADVNLRGGNGDDLAQLAAMRERYERSHKTERSVILGEFVAITGYHSKHAIRLLASAGNPQITQARQTRRRYDADAR